MLQVRGAGERGLNVAHCLHQSLSRLCHLLHLYVVQQPSLFLTGHACFKQQRREQFNRIFSLNSLGKLSMLTLSGYGVRAIRNQVTINNEMFDLSHHYAVLFTLSFDSYAIDGISCMHVIHY